MEIVRFGAQEESSSNLLQGEAGFSGGSSPRRSQRDAFCPRLSLSICRGESCATALSLKPGTSVKRREECRSSNPHKRVQGIKD